MTPRILEKKATRLLLRNRELALVHRRQDVHRLLPVDLAADRKSRPEDLPHRPLELLCLALEAHLPSNVEERVLRDVAVVGDVLHLLTVTRRLLQHLDQQTRRRRHEIDLRLAVLDRELHQHANALPGHARLDDGIPDHAATCRAGQPSAPTPTKGQAHRRPAGRRRSSPRSGRTSAPWQAITREYTSLAH